MSLFRMITVTTTNTGEMAPTPYGPRDVGEVVTVAVTQINSRTGATTRPRVTRHAVTTWLDPLQGGYVDYSDAAVVSARREHRRAVEARIGSESADSPWPIKVIRVNE